MDKFTRTAKLKLYKRSEIDGLLALTKELFNKVVTFYFEVIQDYKGV